MTNRILRVVRKRQLFNKKRDIQIYSNKDVLIDSIANGESKTIRVDDDLKSIYLKLDWIMSNEITVNNLENKQLLIETNIKDRLIYISIFLNIISLLLLFLEFYILSLVCASFSFLPFVYYFFINKDEFFKIEYVDNK